MQSSCKISRPVHRTVTSLPMIGFFFNQLWAAIAIFAAPLPCTTWLKTADRCRVLASSDVAVTPAGRLQAWPMPEARDREKEKADERGKDGGGDADGGKPSNITVAVRVRPLNAKEEARESWATVEVLDEYHVLVNDPDDKMGGIDYLRLDKTKTKHYRFDHAFGPTCTQEEVYNQTTRPLAYKALEGYNACCFAYGQLVGPVAEAVTDTE